MGVNRHNTHALRRAFGAVLREAREAAGLSQEELALRDDFHPTYPSMLERGLRMPTLGTLKDLGAVLDIPPAQLVADALAREGAAHGSSKPPSVVAAFSSLCPGTAGGATLGSTEEATGPRLNTLSREITPPS